MASKLDLAAIVVAGCVMLSIERGNDIFTDVPAHTDRSALAAAADCPDNDNMPYPESCLVFLEGKLGSGVRGRRAAERSVARPAAVMQDVSISPGVECPATDAVPYGARCIAFLTGWFWKPNTPH